MRVLDCNRHYLIVEMIPIEEGQWCWSHFCTWEVKESFVKVKNWVMWVTKVLLVRSICNTNLLWLMDAFGVGWPTKWFYFWIILKVSTSLPKSLYRSIWFILVLILITLSVVLKCLLNLPIGIVWLTTRCKSEFSNSIYYTS
jgi:hypothetical protein